MTLDELESLRPGEVVVFTKVDEMITDYHEYEVGDELEFMDIYTMDKHGRDVVNFYRKVPGEMGVIAHFSYSICDYIERKVLLERDRKLNDILI
jgi:hypothetical protein